MTLVHGDDYVSSALPGDLEWLQAELEKQYEIKAQRSREEVDGGRTRLIFLTIS